MRDQYKYMVTGEGNSERSIQQVHSNKGGEQ